jgi:hypothetical protein
VRNADQDAAPKRHDGERATKGTKHAIDHGHDLNLSASRNFSVQACQPSARTSSRDALRLTFSSLVLIRDLLRAACRLCGGFARVLRRRAATSQRLDRI